MVKDIYKQLHMKEPVESFNSSSFRSNLYYEVCLKETLGDPYGDLAKFAIKSLSGVPQSEEDCWVRPKAMSLFNQISVLSIVHAGICYFFSEHGVCILCLL